MALRDRGVWFGRRRWIMAVVGGVLVLGVLPGGAVESVLAQDPPAPACEQGLFAEGVTSPASCPTSATTTDVSALALPSGFAESTVFSGLTNPINIEFAADGRIFVAEKSGVIKVYDNLNDTTPTSFGVLPPNVHNFWDRGLLGLALDPSLTNPALPSRPWIYVLYAYDHILGNPTAPPRWGDTCPSPPGPTTDGCVVSGRLSRFTVSGTTISGPENVLIEDWCQQFPSHSQGNLAFGPDGALYVSAGDGASFNVVDYGQLGGTSGTPPPTAQNPCSDPALEGGALRSQDLRTEPVGGGGGASYADAVAQDTPIAWYRMGEPSGAVVDQTGGSDGTAFGGVTRDIPGPIGASDDGAIDFNGTSGYVSVPHQAKLSLGNGPWSIELWARRDSIGGNYRFMVDKGEPSPGMYFDITSNRFTLEKSNNPIVARESGSTTDSNWHHWVATRSADGLTTRIYKDGTNVTVLVSAQTFASTTTAMFIGAFVTGGPGFHFDGAIDEVAVYNVELPTSRVEAHYAAASGGGATEPVTLDGAILRVDPVTGAAFTGNPFAASSDANKRRIIAYGLRNPFRFDVRPGTNEIWVGDVGWNAWEEINRVASIGDATVENFGWPCLRRHRAPERLRRGKPADLRGAVPGERGGYCSDVHLQSQRQRSVGRRLSDWWLIDGRHHVLSRIWGNLPGGVPGWTLLRGLHPELHLVDGQRCRRPAGSRHASCLRQPRCGARRPGSGPRRRPVLRGVQRNRPPRPVLVREPAADRHCPGCAFNWSGTPDRHVRRSQLDRS